MSSFSVSNLRQHKDYLEQYQFDVTDHSPAFLNSLRRILCERIPIFACSKVNIIKNESSVKDEMLAKSIKLVRFRQIINKVKIDYSSLRLEINVTAKDDIQLVTSSDIKLFYKNKKVQVKGNHFIPNIYLCALNKGKSLELIGQFEQKTEYEDGAHSCVARVGYEEVEPAARYQFNLHIHETFTFNDLMLTACNVFRQLLESFEKTLALHIRDDGVAFETTQFDDTILNVIVDAIHFVDKNVLFAAYNRHHMLTNDFSFIVKTKNINNVLTQAFAHVRAKIDMLQAAVTTK